MPTSREAPRAALAVAFALGLLWLFAACVQKAEEVAPEDTARIADRNASPTISPPTYCEAWLAYPEFSWPREIRQYDAILLGRVKESNGLTARTYRVSVLKDYTGWGPEPGSSVDVVELVPDFGQAPCEPAWLARVGQFAPMQSSQTYLLFLNANNDGTGSGPFMGRFLVDECGTLKASYERPEVDALQSIPGRYLEDLRAQMEDIYESFGPEGRPMVVSEGQLVPAFSNPYESLESMVGWNQDIFIGTVQERTIISDQETPYGTYTNYGYTVLVEDMLLPGTLSSGRQLRMQESWPVTAADLTLEIGGRYLIFIGPDVRAEIPLVPSGTFSIDDCGRVQPRYRLPSSTFFDTLAGRKLEEAEVLIQQELAQLESAAP